MSKEDREDRHEAEADRVGTGGKQRGWGCFGELALIKTASKVSHYHDHAPT